MLVTVLKSFLSVSNMKIIYNFTPICTLFIPQFPTHLKELQERESSCCLLHLLTRLTRSAVAILWDNVGEALNLSQEAVHGSQESGK